MNKNPIPCIHIRIGYAFVMELNKYATKLLPNICNLAGHVLLSVHIV